MDFSPPYARRGLEHDPQWYRRAVFYEVMVRAFYDADGDGVGHSRPHQQTGLLRVARG